MSSPAKPSVIRSKRGRRITREQVYEAADQILLRGQRPTVQSVLKYLRAGAPNTINKHLNDYWADAGRRLLAHHQQRARLVPLLQKLLALLA